MKVNPSALIAEPEDDSATASLLAEAGRLFALSGGCRFPGPVPDFLEVVWVCPSLFLLN